ncbi:hypothetical protein LSTR_LSTR015058 [Laodelphax striatellus]|uniref:3-dehydrosphinganine reductase n=1 Tax=Laodelphax striatellus TaxID=195883 RepID=A0A482X5D4_LAOST|nr:hypothetical protein LSTR_LSTR015058 [Laodelphax striatellus]UVW99784.1 3-dehydrosphinganine reductase [Laodelphax striatellus]
MDYILEYSNDPLTFMSTTSLPTFGIAFVSIIFAIYLLVDLSLRAKRRNALLNKHVLVTGGSCGIGRSVALAAASRGAHVTIIARNEARLARIHQELVDSYSECHGKQIFQQISLDVTANYDVIEKVIRCAEEYAGPVHMLVNCAGTSICSKFEDTPLDQFERMIKLNLLGSVSPAKAVIRGMKARGSGHIVFTASQAALLGIYGYSAYSASKFALRGVAESLHMEVKPYGVCVTVALPPDTDTPGFAEEEKAKLEETRLISQSSGLFTSDKVAEKILDDAIMGKFFSTVGLEGSILTTTCAGMSPVGSFFELMWQILLMGPLRLVSACYLYSFGRIVEKCMRKRDIRKRSE